ncbi:hypothetical protein [Streptomyces sp. NBC_01565]|uniref:hypothetical protein n=1 Tax=unclassified Streptomyces TaxID=2593676 RepID=UPI00225153CB|nr:hypothetical protein [Streptomyces sp. NBC_01565]MCX4545654.1 hypothetical protein [Streptomyces sp. NBC_01565]
MTDAGATVDAAAVRARAAVDALRELARERPDEVELLDGFTDAELDAWPVEVPEAVRIVLREAGGLETEDDEYAFGPRGRQVFGDGYWALGEPDFGEGSLIVGTGSGDWGPVLSLYPSRDDRDVTVEAPGFIGWLADLVEGLRSAEEPPEPTAWVRAVPTIEVAGRTRGADAELAALVGRGDSLTDLVDLRDLPGYPCRVDWEPYFSTRHNTADTGSSEVGFRLVGDGRALLLRSEVIGDFLERPVRRHPVPADAAHRAVAELRDLAGGFPRYVVLEPGCPDSVIDAWSASGPLSVSVPEDVRVVLRAIGAVAVAGLPALRLLPGAPEHEVDPELHRMLGGDGTYWPLARVDYGRSSALAQIRIDPVTGEWGYAVSVPADPAGLAEHPEVTLLAESLPDLLLTFARLARAAAAAPDTGFAQRTARAARWLFPNTGEPWPRPVPVAEWAASADPLLSAAAAEFPAGTHAADLRAAPIPSDLCFYRARDWPSSARLDRLHFPAAGHLAAAAPVR